MTPRELFTDLAAGMTPTREHLTAMLELTAPDDLEALYRAAYQVKSAAVGRSVHFRGLIEISNVCTKNCYYCGIRRDNRNVHRYTMSEDEIVEAAKIADNDRFGSIVLQGGERSDPAFILMVERVLKRIIIETGGRLGVTLSLGEQTRETFLRWREAGAHRYLLRIEASNPDLYRRLHPADHSWEKRRECLSLLQNCGYQTGTGTMSGLPGQTVGDLVDDLLFFRDMDIDMIGMGPYLVHPDTPLAAQFPDFEQKRERQLQTGLKMIAAARLLLRDVNIASTTALQALRPDGRELGLLAGANVIMPNVSAPAHKGDYQLYVGKPGLNDGPDEALGELRRAIEKIGETLALDQRGDPKHFFARTGKKPEKP